MKKQRNMEIILILVTFVFAAFTVGYFLGRNSTRAVITTTDMTVTVEDLERAEAEQKSEQMDAVENVPAEKTEQPETQTETGLININTATQSELETLPGIGEELARRIMEHRKSVGGFREKTDICDVMGIGEKKYKAIESLITVR